MGLEDILLRRIRGDKTSLLLVRVGVRENLPFGTKRASPERVPRDEAAERLCLLLRLLLDLLVLRSSHGCLSQTNDVPVERSSGWTNLNGYQF